MKTRLTLPILLGLALLLSPAFAPRLLATRGARAAGQRPPGPGSTVYLDELAKATYASLLRMVEPGTGLPHDRFDAVWFDVAPQFAVARQPPRVDRTPGAQLEPGLCQGPGCAYTGSRGLSLRYLMPPGNWGSYNIESSRFDASQAVYLEVWARGALGGERVEVVLWSSCSGPFPGRPESALLSLGPAWERHRIPLADFQPTVDLASLCRLSIGFNDAIHPGGTIYLDQIAFVDSAGSRVHLPLDEETNVTNTGLYMASLVGALERRWETPASVNARLELTLASLEALPKWHGFPQTHNRVLSLTPSTGDTCISTVDSGNLAAGLILVRQRVPALAARAGALLDAMAWDWLYDDAAGLPYGCRYPDSSASTWHYDWLAADSRLAHFIGIGSGGMPADSWDALRRDRDPSACAGGWHYEPGWDGGGLFMAYLPGIFIDESRDALSRSAHQFTRDQICRARQIGAPAWGWSATALPDGAYCGYGCVRDDILVPHASMLAAGHVSPAGLTRNLRALESLGARPRLIDGGQSLDFGFRASVHWPSGQVAPVYLFLDQGMAFLSLTHPHTHGRLRHLFCQDPIVRQARLLLPDYDVHCPKC